MNLQDEMEKAVDNIRSNHNKIIDDWCKAYLAQRYKEGKSIDVGSFTLCQQNLSWAQNEVGFKYWFEDGKPNYKDCDGWIKCSDREPPKETLLLGYGESNKIFIFYWAMGDWHEFHVYGEIAYEVKPLYWMPLPEAPKDE